MIRHLLVLVVTLFLVVACENPSETTTDSGQSSTGTATNSTADNSTDTTSDTEGLAENEGDALENAAGTTPDAAADSGANQTDGVVAGGGAAMTMDEVREEATTAIEDAITLVEVASEDERQMLVTHLEEARTRLELFYQNTELAAQDDWETLQINFDEAIEKVRTGADDAATSLEDLLARVQGENMPLTQ